MNTPKTKPCTRNIVEKLSSQLYMVSTRHRFKEKKSPYDEGVLKAIDWMQELCLHYVKEDERLKQELKEALEVNLKKIGGLKRTAKTQGILDAIQTARDYIKK